MKRGIIRIITWFGLMFAFTFTAATAWGLLSGGDQSIRSLRWLQFTQTLCTFAIPPILCAMLWDEKQKPFRWLRMDRIGRWEYLLWGVGIMLAALPAINLFADLNGRLNLPESLDFIEQFMREQEEKASEITKRFLQADNFTELLGVIGLMALHPALTEELTFRGTLQQIMYRGQGGQEQKIKMHLAVWTTAILFSAIHMQFFGFIPRMLLGAILGYAFAWSGSLWVPIVMHFTNNFAAVLSYYFCAEEGEINIADTLGAGDTWWLGVMSAVITCLGLLIFYRRTHRQ